MKFMQTVSVTAALAVAPMAANAALCDVGTCEVNGGILANNNPTAIQDENVEVGDYFASGSFGIMENLPAAGVRADVAFDEILAGQTEVAAGFSNLTIEFFQDAVSLGSFLLTNPDGTTNGGAAMQSFMVSFISNSDVDFEIEGLAFLNSGASLPDYNINLKAVPGPAALPLLLSGLAGLGFSLRKKKAQA